MEKRNPGIDFETCFSTWFCNPSCSVELPAIRSSVDNLISRRGKDSPSQLVCLLRAVTCLDLTTLCGDDTYSNVQRLCNKAVNPINKNILSMLDFDPPELSCGAVCVYPAQIPTCVEVLSGMGSSLPIAAVAGGFPSGQCQIQSKVREIRDCIEYGATEIDIVINRELVLCGEWKRLYEELKVCRLACEGAKLKTIIAVGELASLSNVYKTSMICMAAGSDFIKTSTGKETVNASLVVGTVMARAIKDYCHETGYKVGFKPAGGIRTSKDVLLWQELMAKELDEHWLYNNLFRIGASSLLGDIEETITQAILGGAGKLCLPYL